jgi:hypothetical protein
MQMQGIKEETEKTNQEAFVDFPITWAPEAARRIIESVAKWNTPARLRCMLGDVGYSCEELCLSELIAILFALKAELESGRYPDELRQRILFAAPLAQD